jgi:hypothetical protein
VVRAMANALERLAPPVPPVATSTDETTGSRAASEQA